MSLETRVVKNAQTVEYGKFVEIQNDTRFPAVSVVRTHYPDTSNAFPNNQNVPPSTSVEIYPKFAVLTYDVTTGQTNGNPFGDNSSVDAFGRLRVSQPGTLLDAKHLYGDNRILFDQALSGTADAIFTLGNSCINMTTSNRGDYVIRQTKQKFNYSPGKSIQGLMTGTFGTEDNIVKRVGLFTGSFTAPYHPIDGIYLENNSGKISLNIVKTQGTTSTENIPQSA